MITLQQYCERPLPTTVRIELFCRLLQSLDAFLKRRPSSKHSGVSSKNAGDIDVAGGVEAGVVVDNVGLLRVAEVVFALRPSRLVHETCPGAPWVLEHIVARLREGSAPLPTVLLKALQPFRCESLGADLERDVDDNALEDVRRGEAKALIEQATRLATATGPGEAVLWALDEACRVDPDFGDPRDRRARVASTAGVDVDHLRVEVQAAMHKVLHQKDMLAAVRVAAVLYGPGADPRRVLEPLGTRVTLIEPVEPPARSRAAVLGVFVSVALVCAGAAFFFVVKAPAPSIAVAPPTPPPPPPAPPPPAPTPAPSETPKTTTTLQGPAIVNVWLEGCGDCMPTFAAWSALAERHGLPGDAPVINIAYGSERPTTRDFAARYHVDAHLGFDVDGSLIVQRTGIGTFTTFVIDKNSEITWRGRAVDANFAADLADAWTLVMPKPKPNASSPSPSSSSSSPFEASLREAQEAIMTGEFNKAVPILKELEKRAPNDPRIHRNLGISYARLRDNAEAARHYRRYLELNPDAADADKVRQILGKSR